ncbi:MAG: hypothetical protein BWY79_00063 [Actinobacteria bacterium ADurb.Bin444]|nr:MAG: hypothetical protein BWY79_00063 [Actinobacteria bacterium ADurb.Bin444]
MSAEEPEGGYRIAQNVLEAIARRALECEKRAQLHTGGLARGKGIEVSMDGLSCRATVHLDGLLGEDLVQVGTDLQVKVARALTRMTGCNVDAVDVVFERVYASLTSD